MVYFLIGLSLGCIVGFVICTILTVSKMEELSYYRAREEANHE